LAVTFTHAEEGARDHETADERTAVAPEILKDGQRNAAMQIPALHCERNDEAAEEQVNHLVCEGCGGVCDIGNAEQWKKHQRE
jgi:hypothetical protein